MLTAGQVVACLNAEHGCEARLARRLLAQHLSRCPASLAVCSHTWNRWPRRLTPEPRHYQAGQLDYELVLRDQRAEAELAGLPRRVRVQLANYITPRHPPAPARQFRLGLDGGLLLDSVTRAMQQGERERAAAWARELAERGARSEAGKLQSGGLHNHCRTCFQANCTLGKARPHSVV